MAQSLLYCPVCGAANAPGDSVCFACKQSLTLYIAGNEQTGLLRERYQVLSQVGVGGFGAVYKALDVQDEDHLVAIKQINLHGLNPREIIDATDGFNREVQILSGLSHAHLPRIHAHFTDPEHWYVVMDFIEGETLEQYLRDATSSAENAIRTLALDEILAIGLQLCSVLAYLHSRQPPIIFRDLKPANIMRTRRGQLYLVDFGIARYFKPGQTRDTSPLGSPGYAAPEQYGRAQTDQRADIYSLGALLHHLISRRDPSEVPFALAPLRLSGAAGQSELAALVARMVNTDAEQRPASIAEVETALLHIHDLRETEPHIWRPTPGQPPPPPVLGPGSYRPGQMQQQVMSAAPPRSAKTVAPKKKSRRRFLAGSLALTGVIALGGASYWKYWHPSRLVSDASFPQQLQVPLSTVSTIAWSPDGQQVAFGLSDGSIMGNMRDNEGNLTVSFTLNAGPNASALPIDALAWSPDGTQLVSISQPGLFQLWDMETQYRDAVFSVSSMDRAIAVAWSPSGQHLAAVNEQLVLHIYDTSAGFISDSDSELTEVSGLAWSPDSSSLVIALPTSSSSSNSLRIWNVNLDSELATIPLSSFAINALAWSPDGQNIAVLGDNGMLQVWSISRNNQNSNQNNAHLVFFRALNGQQSQLAWSPDGHFLATIDYTNNLLVLDRSSGAVLASAPLTGSPNLGAVFSNQALTWLPDSQHIVVANSAMEYWLWSLSWF